MFDIGFWEMSLIALIALIVLGPERLPALARTVGLWMGRARRMVREVKADIDREVRAAEMKEMQSLKKDIEETGREMSDELSKASNAGKKFKDKNIKDSKIRKEFDLSDAIQDSASEVSKDAPAPAQSGTDAKE